MKRQNLKAELTHEESYTTRGHGKYAAVTSFFLPALGFLSHASLVL